LTRKAKDIGTPAQLDKADRKILRLPVLQASITGQYYRAMPAYMINVGEFMLAALLLNLLETSR